MIWKEGDLLPSGCVLANDGLPARDQGEWARDKLKFLEAFEVAALGATQKKRGNTYYIDLFAGPGLNVFREESGLQREFPGSPIRAVRAVHKGKSGDDRFGGCYLCNSNPFDHDLLSRRMKSALEEEENSVMRNRVHLLLGDANVLVHDIVKRIPAHAYLLIFADIEGPGDIAFDTIRALKQKHRSVDLYILYPTDLGIERLIPYKDPLKNSELLDRYYGTSDWQPIALRRTTSAQADRMRKELFDFYLSELRSLWKRVEPVLKVKKINRELYDMVFASDHDAAWSIAAGASRKTEELGLFDGLN